MSDALLPTSKLSSSNADEDHGRSTHVKMINFSSIWTIDKFCSCAKKTETGQELTSSTFSVGANEKFKWQLSVYLKGKDRKTEDYLSVYLRLVTCDKTKVRVNFKFSILNKMKEKKKVKEWKRIFRQDDEWGFPRFILRHCLLKPFTNLLVNGKLTLCCEINIAADPIDICRQDIPQRSKIPECSLDMEQLFESQRLSDFVVSVNGQEFFVHKIILASRSKVFAAMFEHEMEEKKKNRVEITGMNAEVMKEMLRFIYTGKVSCLENIANDLLVAADKYSVDRLKAICEEAIYANLSVDTASDILALADLHSADQLKAHAMDFITRHATEVTATSGWKTMATQRPHLTTEAFQALAIQHTPSLGPPRKKPKFS